jgi:molybdopterin synthase catalytic subunit
MEAWQLTTVHRVGELAVGDTAVVDAGTDEWAGA